MQIADDLPDVEVHRRRSHRRSTRSRVARKVKHGWRRTKFRKGLFTMLLGLVVVVGGYKVTMYVLEHHALNSLEEFRTSDK